MRCRTIYIRKICNFLTKARLFHIHSDVWVNYYHFDLFQFNYYLDAYCTCLMSINAYTLHYSLWISHVIPNDNYGFDGIENGAPIHFVNHTMVLKLSKCFVSYARYEHGFSQIMFYRLKLCLNTKRLLSDLIERNQIICIHRNFSIDRQRM